MEASLTKVEELREIMKYRVMATPALVIDGELKCAGRLPTVAEMVTWIVNRAAATP